MRKSISRFVALFLLVLVVLGLSFYFKTVCYGPGCINKSTVMNACLQDDSYFYPNRGESFEYSFYIFWFIKTMFLPERNLYITLFDEKKIVIVPYKNYRSDLALIDISKCVTSIDLSFVQGE